MEQRTWAFQAAWAQKRQIDGLLCLPGLVESVAEHYTVDDRQHRVVEFYRNLSSQVPLNKFKRVALTLKTFTGFYELPD